MSEKFINNPEGDVLAVAQMFSRLMGELDKGLSPAGEKLSKKGIQHYRGYLFVGAIEELNGIPGVDRYSGFEIEGRKFGLDRKELPSDSEGLFLTRDGLAGLSEENI